ncbi:unnamed protein product [Camellia sinensis]
MSEDQREKGRSEGRSELRMSEDQREGPSDELRISFRSMKMNFQPFSTLRSVNFNPRISLALDLAVAKFGSWYSMPLEKPRLSKLLYYGFGN